MGHHINAFVAQASILTTVAARYKHAQLADLPQGFALLFVTDDFYDEVTMLDPAPQPYMELYFLSMALEQLGLEISQQTPVAFIATDYFGGHGTQAAIVWEAGAVVFGPSEHNTADPNLLARVFTPLAARPINQALRRLGVQRGEAIDEFAALSLVRHRSAPDE